MGLFNWFKKQSVSNISLDMSKVNPNLSEKDKRWNKFIETICFQPLDTLSPIQKNAVLCFWYDAEMNSGGHSGYFDCYPDTEPQELIEAINIVAYEAISDNYIKALNEGEKDGWVETDMAYYKFTPSLDKCLMEYVEANKEEIFDIKATIIYLDDAMLLSKKNYSNWLEVQEEYYDKYKTNLSSMTCNEIIAFLEEDFKEEENWPFSRADIVNFFNSEELILYSHQ